MGYKFWKDQGYVWYAALSLSLRMIIFTPIVWGIMVWFYFFPPLGEQWIDEEF
jgi:hypothetical protein